MYLLIINNIYVINTHMSKGQGMRLAMPRSCLGIDYISNKENVMETLKDRYVRIENGNFKIDHNIM